jgi:type 1 glutamine amidotransferase
MRTYSILLLGLLCARGSSAAAEEKPLRIHLIGTGEYDAAKSLPEYKRYLEAEYRIEASFSGMGKDKQLENLDQLKSADLLILFARRMNLPADQMAIIRDHCEAGKPLIALRTASHAFQPEDNEWIAKVIGAKYAGPGSYTTPFNAVPTEASKDHPLLRGVEPIPSQGPYRFEPLDPKAIVIQVVESDKRVKQPASWVHEYRGGRTFYSTMGRGEDFQNADFRRLLENAVFWTTKTDAEQFRRDDCPNAVRLCGLLRSH